MGPPSYMLSVVEPKRRYAAHDCTYYVLSYLGKASIKLLLTACIRI
jgi:hypothetical protein